MCRGTCKLWQGRKNAEWANTSSAGISPSCNSRCGPYRSARIRFSKSGPLHQRGGQRLPLARRHQQRHGVELPGAFAGQRVGVEVVGDAVFVDQTLGGFPAAAQFGRPHRVERGHELLPMRAGSRPAQAPSRHKSTAAADSRPSSAPAQRHPVFVVWDSSSKPCS